jgi:hypothetical protein
MAYLADSAFGEAELLTYLGKAEAVGVRIFDRGLSYLTTSRLRR